MEQKHFDYLESLGPIMPANVKPVYPGWYAREYSFLFGGMTWLASRDYFDGADWFTGRDDGTQGHCADPILMRWRGLARPAYEPPNQEDIGFGDEALNE